MHWEKASSASDLELRDDDCPDGLDDPTFATPGPDELCEQAVMSSATATSPIANLPLRRKFGGRFTPASVPAGTGVAHPAIVGDRLPRWRDMPPVLRR
jgi:hypothetical protein